MTFKIWIFKLFWGIRLHRYANCFEVCSCEIQISVWILNERTFWCFGSIFSFRHCYNRTAVAQAGQNCHLCDGVAGDCLVCSRSLRSCFSGNISLYRGKWSTSPVCIGVFHSLIETEQKQTIHTTINRKSLAVRSGTPSKTNSLSSSLQILVLAKTST